MKVFRENALNGVGLVLAWTGFIGWFVLAPRMPYRAGVLFLTIWVSLAMQQYIAGIVHEAAHGNFIQGKRRLNELVANIFGAYAFWFNVHGFRMVHFKHHHNTVFLSPDDEETAPVEAWRSEISTGFFKDLFLISAFQLLLLKNRPDARESLWVRVMYRIPVVVHFCILWGGLAYYGSPWFVVVYFATFVTIYPLSARLRAWGTHGNLYAREGLRESPVSRNLMSPVYERVFIGNRMMMYHYEHHRNPHLTFRQCEKTARERYSSFAQAGGPIETRTLEREDGLPVFNVQAPSYWFFIRNFLRGGFTEL